MLYLSLFRCCSALAACLLVGMASRADDLFPSDGVPSSPRRVRDQLAQLPLRFEANAGQTDPEARFLARGRGFTLYLTASEAVLALNEVDRSAREPEKGNAIGHANRPAGRGRKTIQNTLRLALPGSNPQAEIAGIHPLSGPVSYFVGNDPSRWRSAIETFDRVQYRGIYPGIDLVFYGNQGQLEYDFNIAPGADPAVIRLQFSGASNMALTDGGDLVISVAGGSLRWRAPVAFQDIDGVRRPVTCSFLMPAADQLRFAVGAYDPAQPLIIDPLLVYSTYLGGSAQDVGQSIDLDGAGNVYVTGQTDSLNFPTNRAFRGTNSGGAEVFVSRLNTNGTAFLYSTYVGGSGVDIGYGIAVDSGGNAAVSGYTESANFPTKNPAQSTLRGGADAFVFKLGPNGTNLIYSSYFGGDGFESAYAVAVDSGTNSVYICGETSTSSKNQFPNNMPSFQNLFGGAVGGSDAFVARFNTGGSGSGSLTWWSWLGGGDDDIARAIAVDSTNGVYVAGEILSCDFDFGCSPSFPVKNAFQPKYGGYFSDAFVTKIAGDGNSVVWSSYLGGTNDDVAYGIALDSANNVFVTGATSSTNFPVLNAFQPANGGSDNFFSTLDGFMVKIRANGSGLFYGTYIGGSIDDEAHAVAIDIAGNAWVTGKTSSDDFPNLNGPLQARFGGDADAFVTVINPNQVGSSSLVFSTYLGGPSQEIANGIAVDTNGNCVVIGKTTGTNSVGSIAGVVQPNFGGGFSDAFVTKIFAPPLLSIERSGTNHIATWRTFPTGYSLISRTNVNTGTWSNVPGAVTISNAMNRVVVTNVGRRKFLELRKP